jgi:hypothetical protein
MVRKQAKRKNEENNFPTYAHQLFEEFKEKFVFFISCIWEYTKGDLGNASMQAFTFPFAIRSVLFFP